MDAIILENPYLLGGKWKEPNQVAVKQPSVPQGITDGVPPDVYNAYRLGRDSACVDQMLAARRPSGEGVVLLMLRGHNVCFSRKWWMTGGALAAYTPVSRFVAARTEKECGVFAEPQITVGVYRTCAPDMPGSTLQPCYASVVEFEVLQRRVEADSSHTQARLFTFDDLDRIPLENRHWYPIRVARLVLQALP